MKMENLKNFEEYMYRPDSKTKKERSEKSKEWFILKLVKMSEDKNELENMSIADLGKLYAEKIKK